MAFPVVTEKPTRQPTGTDERGPRRIRQFDIYAGSKQEAYNLLGAGDGTVPGHVRGTVYQEPQTGLVIDPALVVQGFTDRAHPPAPAIEGGKGLYEITAHFGYSRTSYREPALPAPEGEETPTPRYRVERADESVPIDHDVNGDPIANSIGDVLDPPPMDIERRQTLVIEWLVDRADWLTVYAEFRDYENKINNAEYKGAAKWGLLCTGIDIQETTLPPKASSATGNKWFRLAARLEYRPGKTLFGTFYAGWEHTVLNRGRRARYFLEGTSGPTEIRVVVDSRGYPVPDPVLLKADGHELISGDPHVISWFTKDEISFDGLGV